SWSSEEGGMQIRKPTLAAACLMAIVTLGHIGLIAQLTLFAQNTSSSAGSSSSAAIPRTSEGHPDLTGTWDYATTTPMERMQMYVGKPFTEEERQAIAKAGTDRAHNLVRGS